MGSEGNAMLRCPYRPLVPRMPLPVTVAMVTAGKGVYILNVEKLTLTAMLSVIGVGALSPPRGAFQPLSLSCISEEHFFFLAADWC